MCLHTRNLQILVTNVFMVKIGELPSMMYKVFQIDCSNNYKLRKNRGFEPCTSKTVYYVTEIMDNFTWRISELNKSERI